MNVHHGHFIDDDDIRFQRILFVSLKMAARRVLRAAGQFQHPVNCLGLTAGGLRHPLGCPPRRRRQTYFQPFIFKEPNHRIDGRRLSRTWAAGNDKHTVPRRLDHCRFLHLVETDFFIRLNPMNLMLRFPQAYLIFYI